MKRPLKILLVGGGSGGHIWPAAQVSQELLDLGLRLDLQFWCDSKTKIMAQKAFEGQAVKVRSISAGKFRRYHHLKWWQNLHPGILGPNILDLLKIILGFCQALIRLLIWRPAVVFAKGGFVCLPVGLVASLLGIKLVIHDSDTVPGVTNRILARFAVRIATGYPVKFYDYSLEKAVFTGIPTRKSLQKRPNRAELTKLRKELKLPVDQKVVLVTGGGLGAQILNRAILDQASKIKATVVLVVGEHDLRRAQDYLSSNPAKNVRLFDFLSNLDQYILASDLVVARAGATTIAELSVAAKPVILVPNPRLTGGHQISNANLIKKQQAGWVIEEGSIEKRPVRLVSQIDRSLKALGSKEAKQMTANLAAVSRPQAAKHIAEVILSLIDPSKISQN